MAAKRRSAWAEACRPVTCAELAAAMYRAGQTPREVVGRLAVMGRWSTKHVLVTAYAVGQELRLVFARGGDRYVAKPFSDGTRAAARVALLGQPEETRRRYRTLRRYGRKRCGCWGCEMIVRLEMPRLRYWLCRKGTGVIVVPMAMLDEMSRTHVPGQR